MIYVLEGYTKTTVLIVGYEWLWCVCYREEAEARILT